VTLSVRRRLENAFTRAECERRDSETECGHSGTLECMIRLRTPPRIGLRRTLLVSLLGTALTTVCACTSCTRPTDEAQQPTPKCPTATMDGAGSDNAELDGLVSLQLADGGWGSPAATSMALMAFCAHGNTPVEGLYARVVSRAEQHILARSLDADPGAATADSLEALRDAALAYVAVSELAHWDADPETSAAVERARVRFDRRWRSGRKWGDLDDSRGLLIAEALGWSATALRCIRLDHGAVPDEEFQRAAEEADQLASHAPSPTVHRAALAVAVFCRESAQGRHVAPAIDVEVAQFIDEASTGPPGDWISAYFGSLAVIGTGSRALWSRWEPMLTQFVSSVGKSPSAIRSGAVLKSAAPNRVRLVAARLSIRALYFGRVANSLYRE